MSGHENPNASPESQKAPKFESKYAERGAKERFNKAAEITPADKIDDTPLPAELSTRERPPVELKAGEIDLSDKAGFRDFNNNILELAKKNMTSREEYGDKSEITVDNTGFLLTKKDNIAYVVVSVYGKSSKARIEQHVPLQIDNNGEIAYNMPPLKDQDVETVDPEVKKLA